MKRSKHSLSNYRLLTMDMGQLVPVNLIEVLPGDVIQQSTSALVRVSPLVAPVMHPVTVRCHHWFVPHRLVWAGFEDFITGGPDGLGGSAGAFPTITHSGVIKDLPDYLGVPLVAGQSISALPIRAYNRIFNENYRDEDLVTPLAVPTTSGVDVTSPKVVQKIAWEKDYFTSARPWAQKGPAVTLPLGTSAPVTGAIDGQNLEFRSATSGGGVVRTPNVQNDGSKDVVITAAADSETVHIWKPSTAVGAGDLTADLSTATAADVNTIRRAFALQRYQEARSRYGSRYTEYLKYLGIRASDQRLQRPEYLGGGKQVISFSEVLQTGTNFDANTGVASLKGHGISAVRSRRYRRFFEEHGYIISLLSVRPRSIYGNSLARHWSKRTKEDFFQKELEAIGQQAIQRREVFAEAGAGGDTTFGYQNRYDEYRHEPSTIHAEFRTILNYWHMARIFGAAPTLNASFVECDATKRIHAEQTNNSLWVMVSNNIQARRMVNKFAATRVL